MRDRHVVVGAGPLGRAVVEALLRSVDADGDAEKVAIRLVNRSEPTDVSSGVETVRADVREPADAVAACAGASVVYDCVGLPYPEWAANFPAITAGILHGARAADARVVASDNLYAYGPVDGQITEDTPMEATDAKGRVRAARTSQYLENGTDRPAGSNRGGAAGDERPVPVAIGRAGNFFGPGVVDTSPLRDPFGSAIRGERVAALGSLDQPHSFSFVPDVAAALVALGGSERALGRIWHVPHLEPVTVRQLVEAIGDAAGTDPAVRTLPGVVEALLGVVNSDVRELRAISHQYTRPFVVDDSRFAAAFDVAPTPLADAVDRTVAWHRARLGARAGVAPKPPT